MICPYLHMCHLYDLSIFSNENEINGHPSITELMREDVYNFHKTILEGKYNLGGKREF